MLSLDLLCSSSHVGKALAVYLLPNDIAASVGAMLSMLAAVQTLRMYCHAQMKQNVATGLHHALTSTLTLQVSRCPLLSSPSAQQQHCSIRSASHLQTHLKTVCKQLPQPVTSAHCLSSQTHATMLSVDAATTAKTHACAK